MATYRGNCTNTLIPLIVILGPTACGKSDWVNSFAKKYSGEVVSADSRQVYKDFSIGTNKERGIWKKQQNKRVYRVDGVSYHLIDFVSPKAYFSVYEYRQKAHDAIKDIYARGYLPFMAGGTGMYIDAVVDNWKLTKRSHDPILRKELKGKSNIELLHRLKENDPETAARIDVHNAMRLIRAIEIVELTGRKKGKAPEIGKDLYTTLKIGIDMDREKLYEKINKRVNLMMKEGLVDEVRKLYTTYDKNLPVFFSIGYREIIDHFEGRLSLPEAKEAIKQYTRHYAKRQMTWWRKDKRIHWCGTKREAERLIRDFVKTI